MRDRADDFVRLFTGAEDHAPQFELRAFMERDIQFDPPIASAKAEHVHPRAGSGTQHKPDLPDAACVLQDRTVQATACGNQNMLCIPKRPKASERIKIAVTPGLVAARRKGRRKVQAARSL